MGDWYVISLQQRQKTDQHLVLKLCRNKFYNFTIQIKFILKDGMSHTVQVYKHTKTIKHMGAHSHAHTYTEKHTQSTGVWRLEIGLSPSASPPTQRT